MKLQQEIKQSKPFQTVQQEAILALMRTTDVLKRRVLRLVEVKNLSPEQYNVLRILRGAGPHGLPTLEVASRLIERTPAITRLLDKLEKKLFVKRRRCSQDRRQVFCYITRAGLQILEQIGPHLVRQQTLALAQVSERELRSLIRILEKIRQQDEEAMNRQRSKTS